jgi:hypothetical protein
LLATAGRGRPGMLHCLRYESSMVGSYSLTKWFCTKRICKQTLKCYMYGSDISR